MGGRYARETVSQQPPGTDPTSDPEGASTPEPTPPPQPPPTVPDEQTTRVPWEAPPPIAPSGLPPAGESGPGAPGAGGTGPTVLWATPTSQAQMEVHGAPGLSFADTTSRVIAFIIDSFLVGITGSIIAAVLGYGRTSTFQSGTTSGATVSVQGAAFAVPFVVLGFLYYVFFWSGGRRATLGQRIFNLQVGNAFDGQPLTLSQAVKRWLGLGLFLSLFAVTPAIYGFASLAQFVWVIVLFVTTWRSPTKQGLHDRFANTAMVRPSNQSSSGLTTACLIVVVIVLLLFVFSIVALVFLGSQVSDILSKAGNSI
jgi:uncharacterized RDD family membrane protein YckC